MNSRSNKDEPDKILRPDIQFDEIAFLYDELMAGVPYGAWVSYLHRILDRFLCRPNTVLDLCCGTGRVSLILAEEGYQVSGIDISPEMIERARRGAAKCGLHIDFHVQDAAKLRLGRRFQLVVSFFDSLNYILDAAALQQAFHRVAEHLEPEGLFIFDMNTELALAGGFFDQSNFGTRAATQYDWRSSYDMASRICRINMEFIQRRGADERRAKVVHYQRAYDLEEIVSMLGTAGLTTLDVYNAYTFRRATQKSDRAFFVARK